MASRKRSREGEDDDEVAPQNQREKEVDLSDAGVKRKGRDRHNGHEAAASKGSTEGQPSGQDNSLHFVDPLPKLIVLDLDKTVRSQQ